MSMMLDQIPDIRSMEKHVSITCVHDLDLLWPRKDEWNALVQRSSTNTIFQTFEWHMSWWKAFSDSAQLLILIAETDGELVGIAPFMIVRRWSLGRKRRIIEFIGGDAIDYADCIVDQSHAAIIPLFLDWLTEHKHLWDMLYLFNVSDTSPLLSVLHSPSSTRGLIADIQLLHEAPSHVFGDVAEDQQLLKKKSIRRHYNYFVRNGRLECRHYTDAEHISSYLNEMFEQHIQRWSLAGVQSQFLDVRQRLFYHNLATHVSAADRVLFSVLLFNDSPIAFHFGFQYADRIFYIKPAFSVAYIKHSPGEVLLKHLLEYALAHGVRELDFTVGEESYKYRFSNHLRKSYGIRAYHYPLSYQVDTFAIKAKEFVKRSEHMHRLGRYILRRGRVSSRLNEPVAEE